MSNVLVALVPATATVFMIFKVGGKAAEVGVTHSKDVKALLKEHRRVALRFVWESSYSLVLGMAQKLVGKSKNE